MGRRKIPGLRNRSGIWHIEKRILGRQIHESTGTSKLSEAELILARRVEAVRHAVIFGERPKRIFRDAATRYLEENLHLARIKDTARHLRQLDPYIGDLPLQRVHLGTLKPFIEERKRQGNKTKTINLGLSVVRRILNLSARLWRDDDSGLTWLATAPLIQLLPVTDARQPYPISWEEQRLLFQALPDHLAKMCLFKVNTGCREREICLLRWEWEVDVPELGTSVFLIPGENVKNREERLVVLNRIARSVIAGQRGLHEEFVFTYQGHAVTKMYNSAWKRVRKVVGLDQVRIHDLKYTFGRRLRAAGVSLENRKVLLGHTNGDITTHYSAPDLEGLISAAELACGQKSGKTPALVMLKRKAVNG